MTLSADQSKFIAARLLAATDKEAAEAIGINADTIVRWKRASPDFAVEYEKAFVSDTLIGTRLGRFR